MISDSSPPPAGPVSTRSGLDSRGRTWGLEGALLWYAVASLSVFLGAFALAWLPGRLSLFQAAGAASVPALAVAAWAAFLKAGKHPSYDRDLLEDLLRRAGLVLPRTRPAPAAPPHPLFSTPSASSRFPSPRRRSFFPCLKKPPTDTSSAI